MPAFRNSFYRAARAPLLAPSRVLRRPSLRFASSVPTIARPSFWKSLLPKSLRGEHADSLASPAGLKPKSKGWNPATFFIMIFLMIGSMSIHMITLKRDFTTFMRQSDVRIGLLREVVEKIQRGEKVDVERILGAGDAEAEVEWEEVLKEIERDDALRNPKKAERSRPAHSPPSKTGAAGPRGEAAQETSRQTSTTTSSAASFF